jgi:glycosyltransferase involved in cell wall biosynthesis
LQGVENVNVESLDLTPEVTYVADGSASKLSYLKAVPRIRRLHKEFKPDIVHAHYVSSYGLVAAIACLRPRLVSVWGADVFTTPHVSIAHRGMIWWALRTADVVMSTSHMMRTQTKALCERDVFVVPFGIDTKRFRPPEGTNEGRTEIVIGTVKSLERKYGIDVLLKAYARVRFDASAPRSRLVIFGQGSLKAELELLRDELGLSAHVEFRGAVPYATVHRAHQELDIAVFPSVDHSESFGVSVIEAQSCGKPAVVSRVGGLPEVVIENKTALIVPPHDDVALASALTRLLNDRALRERLGAAGREHVVSTYELDTCVSLLESHYSSVLTRS